MEGCRAYLGWKDPLARLPEEETASHGPGHAATEDVSPAKPHLEPKVIQAIVRSKASELRECYQPRLYVKPDLEGRMKVRLVIELDGTVSASDVIENSIPDCYVPECVRQELKSLRFPEPEGGTVNVTYPIEFAPE